MTQAVSLSTQNIANSKKPKYCCTSRFSYPLDAKQTLGLCFIAMMCTPAVAALTPERVKFDNATCSSLSLSRTTIADYLNWGEASHYTSAAMIKAQNLNPENYRHTIYEAHSTLQSRLNEEMGDLLAQAASEYVTGAENDHPAAKAIALHQAIDALEQARELPQISGGWVLDDQIGQLKIQEAQACNEAANLAESTKEKLKWVSRGLKRVRQPLTKSNIANMCQATRLLYITAAKAYQEAPLNTYHGPSDIVHLDFVLKDSRALYSAICLTKAGRFSQYFGDPAETKQLFQTAIETFRSIVPSSLEEQAKVQDLIVETYISARDAADTDDLNRDIYRAALVAGEMYGQLPSTHAIIRRAVNLAIAADNCPDPRERLDYFKKAVVLVHEAQDRDFAGCLDEPAYKNGLLRSLKESKKLAEDVLKQRSGVIQSALNWIGRLWGSSR